MIVPVRVLQCLSKNITKYSKIRVNNSGFKSPFVCRSFSNERPSKEFLIEEYRCFYDAYPKLIEEVLDAIPAKEVRPIMKKMMNYHKNIPNGTMLVPLMLNVYYDLIAKLPAEKRNVDKHQVYRMGLLLGQFSLLHSILDDILDHSVVRYGKLCWYKERNSADLAWVDFITMANTIFAAITKYYKNNIYYVNMLEVYHESYFHAYVGEEMEMDLKTAKSYDNLFDYFIEHSRIKNEYHFVLPIYLAIYLAEYPELPDKGLLDKIFWDCGVLTQLANGVWDFHGKVEKDGKIRYDDVENGIITGYLCTAWEEANPEQRNIIQNNYGRADENSVSKIVEIYDKLNVYEKMDQYIENSFSRMESNIQKIPEKIYQDYFRRVIIVLRKIQRGRIFTPEEQTECFLD